MLVNTVSLAKNCVQLYLLIYTLLPYMKAEPIIVQYIIVQIMDQLMCTRGLSQHYIELDQVGAKPKCLSLLHKCTPPNILKL